MVFSSTIFLFVFLPLFLLLYHAVFTVYQLGKGRTSAAQVALRLSNLIILLFSMVFYFWGEKWLILVMLTSTAIDYLSGLYIGYARSTVARKGAVVVSVVTNLSLLGFFKYMNFGLDAAGRVLSLLGLAGASTDLFIQVSLPLGISFYTFQSMSYTIDVYRGVVKPNRNFLNFACYVTMFPQLVAGPIIRYRDVSRQLTNRSVGLDDFGEGCARFIVGLGKKVLIANTLAVAVDGIFQVQGENLTSSIAWLGLFGFVLQLYFDFSGYSDMAIGLGRMTGFHFRENFNYPFVSQSLTEFWRRWHISLSTWFRDYLYRSLRGARGAGEQQYMNLFLVFLLVGLWHGADWTFLFFGIYHGLMIVLERLGLEKWVQDRPAPLRYLYALPAIYSSFLIFRCDTMDQYFAFVRAMFGMGTGDGVTVTLTRFLTPEVAVALVAGLAMSLPLARWAADAMGGVREVKAVWASVTVTGYEGLRLAGLVAVLLASVISVASQNYNPFIYFRF